MGQGQEPIKPSPKSKWKVDKKQKIKATTVVFL